MNKEKRNDNRNKKNNLIMSTIRLRLVKYNFAQYRQKFETFYLLFINLKITIVTSLCKIMHFVTLYDQKKKTSKHNGSRFRKLLITK